MTISVLGTVPLSDLAAACEAGVALGVALQLTNIVRDVGEDAGRGRLYLPLEDLKLFNLTEEEVLTNQNIHTDPRWAPGPLRLGLHAAIKPLFSHFTTGEFNSPVA
eukprot:7342373-Pyramimonas_sp.AAC.1